MTEAAPYRSRVTVTRSAGPDRSAVLPTGETVTFGVHGGIADHYGIDRSSIVERAATLDYIVAAVGSAMVGTFARTLRTEGLVLDDGQLRAEVLGTFHSDAGELVLAAVEVRYLLTGDSDAVDDAAVERAHRAHAPMCPLVKTLGDCVEIRSGWERVGS